ncbi:MAG: DNA polymerase IV [Clostridiales bacterium]|nr:DNA polymerase IV [Clostridiales bacterium]
MERVILHCDCNSYFASVESIGKPAYKTVPMAVCGDAKSRRGIILAKNELAKGFGIVTAETVYSALRKCPHLLLVSPQHGKYTEYCKKINAVYEQYTDQVEAFGVDESWLDVTGSQHLFGTGKEIADELRRRIYEEFELTISVGVSFNKVFAKLGSDYKKPNATTVITKENYKRILWPLPARDMLFVGKTAADKLAAYGILTIGDIAGAGADMMQTLLGKTGETIWAYACGMDESPVRHAGEPSPVKSVSNGSTFYRDLVSEEDIRAALLMLCDNVATRLRRQGLYCTTVQVQVKDPLLKVISRQRKLPAPTNATRTLVQTAIDIMRASWKRGSPIRLLAVSAGGLTRDKTAQISLLNDGGAVARSERLDDAMDKIREKYGKEALQFGSTIRSDLKSGAKEKE